MNFLIIFRILNNMKYIITEKQLNFINESVKDRLKSKSGDIEKDAIEFYSENVENVVYIPLDILTKLPNEIKEKYYKNKNVFDKRINISVDEGIDTFFNVIASHFPEIKTGDFDPGNTFAMRKDLEEYVRIWYDFNI